MIMLCCLSPPVDALHFGSGSSVFEDEAVAELLTTGKLSELACLTLYMMYEKKEGKKSRWYHYIKELDKQRARGQQVQKLPAPLASNTVCTT